MAQRVEVNFEGSVEPLPSPRAVDRSSFETAALANNEYKCPACGEEKAYDRDDPFFSDTA
jgi:transcription initiation factor IIE alpha subunit